MSTFASSPSRAAVHAPARFALILAVALLAGCGGKTSDQKPAIKVAIGDTIAVTGTKVVCYATNSENKNGMGCFLSSSAGPIPGTYGVGLSEAGDAVVHKVNANGSTTLLWRHTASARAHAATTHTVSAGDGFAFQIKGGYLGCRVLDITKAEPQYQGRKVACWRSTETDPFPNTYGVAVSDKFAGSFKFDANGKAGPDTFVRFQP